MENILQLRISTNNNTWNIAVTLNQHLCWTTTDNLWITTFRQWHVKYTFWSWRGIQVFLFVINNPQEWHTNHQGSASVIIVSFLLVVYLMKNSSTACIYVCTWDITTIYVHVEVVCPHTRIKIFIIYSRP